MLKTKPCKHCGSEYHTTISCFARPRPPMAKKRLNPKGKITLKWLETRGQWIQANPPVDGYWNCYICGTYLNIDRLTLDHIKSRSRHPELRFELNNLRPCCRKCNAWKGSRDLKEIK